MTQDERAAHHRRVALDALTDDGAHATVVALVEALLALEARVEELTCYVSLLG